MGCDYTTSILSSFKNELHSEIVISRKYLLSKNKSPNKFNRLIQKKKTLNLESTKNMGEIDENKNIKNHLKKALTLNNLTEKNELYYSDKFILRLPAEKFNKLFDDNINGYDNNTKNKKEIKQFSFNKFELYFSEKNNLTSSLNTAESTIETENYKKNNINKREIK